MTHSNVPPSGPWWPTTPNAFVDPAVCPACFTPLRSAWCAACGLDLSVPEAHDLLAAGQRLVDVEASRQRLITTMRQSQEEHRAAQEAARHPALVGVSASIDGAAPQVQSPGAPPQQVPPRPHTAQPGAPRADAPQAHGMPPTAVQPTAVPPPHATAPPRPRRSGVQILLLTLGVVLVAIAAIFFLFIAYLVASLETRVALTATMAVGVGAVAAYLQHRRLRGTAEGLATLAAVLLLLDVWIARGSGAWGSDELNAAAFNGFAFLIIAALAWTLGRLSELRAPSIIVYTLVVPGACLAIGGLTWQADPTLAAWAGLAAGGFVGLLGAFAPRPVESLISRIAGYTALVLATGWMLVTLSDSATAVLVLGAVTTGLWLLHSIADRHSQTASVWQLVASVGAGLTASLAVLATFERVPDDTMPSWVGTTGAALIALGVLVAWRRAAHPRTRADALAGFFAASAPPAVIGLGVAVEFFGSFAALLGRNTAGWYSSPQVSPVDIDSLEAAVVLLIGASAAVALSRRARVLAPIPLTFAVLVGLGWFGNVQGFTASMLCYAALAVAALLVLASPDRARLLSRTTRLVLVAAGALAVTGLASVASVFSAGWPWAAIGIVLYLCVARTGVARMVSRPRLRRACAVTLTAATTAAGLFALAFLVSWLEAREHLAAVETLSAASTAGDRAFVPVIVASGILLLIPLVGDRWWTRPERAIVALISALTVVFGAAVFFSASAVFDPTYTRPLVVGVLTAAAVAWQLTRSHVARSGRLIFAAALPVLLPMWAGVLVSDSLRLAAFAPLAACLGTVVAAALWLTLTLMRQLDAPGRLTLQISTGLTSLTVLAWLLGTAREPEWIAWAGLLMLAVVPLLLASETGDPFAGRRASSHIGWFSLPPAIGALWMALADQNAAALEWYTAPVALLLASLTALIAWRRISQDAAGRTILAAATLALAAAPSVFASAGGDTERPLITIAAGVLVALAGLVAPRTLGGLRLRLLLTSAGTLTALVTGAVRARTYLGQLGLADLTLEAWIVPGVVTAVIVAAVWAARTDVPAWVARIAVLLALISVAFVEASAVAGNELPLGRALGTSALLVAVGLAAATVDLDPLTNRMNHAVVIILGAFGLIGLIMHTVAPFELLTAPSGVLLVLSGLVRLDTRDGARTMTQLGLGLGVLLVPTLLADFASPPLWRVVGLGILSVALVAAGVIKRWRAPLLLGAGALAVHAIVQLWPWIRSVYDATGWWLWLGIGGVVLIVLAATYEQRLKNVKNLSETLRAYR